MKLVCKSCKYEQIVQDKSLTQCPRCGSNDIKIFLFGSTSGQGLKIEKSTQAFIIIFLIGIILTFTGFALLSSSLSGGITLIVIGIILLAIGSKGEFCRPPYHC